MRIRSAALVTVVMLSGCGLFGGDQKYSIFFQPYSAKLDDQALRSTADAARFAQGHKLARVIVSGYAAPADPARDVDGLSAQRAEAVKQALVADGVEPSRIDPVANGAIDPKTLPSLAVRRVDITFK